MLRNFVILDGFDGDPMLGPTVLAIRLSREPATAGLRA